MILEMAGQSNISDPPDFTGRGEFSPRAAVTVSFSPPLTRSRGNPPPIGNNHLLLLLSTDLLFSGVHPALVSEDASQERPAGSSTWGLRGDNLSGASEGPSERLTFLTASDRDQSINYSYRCSGERLNFPPFFFFPDKPFRLFIPALRQ